MVIIDRVGCESFAHMAYNIANSWLNKNNLSSRVSLESVEVAEHGSNSAVLS